MIISYLFLFENHVIDSAINLKTYAGSVDRQLIADESLRQAVELQIAHFGQIPQQLFRAPHPPRMSAAARSGAGSAPRLLQRCFSTDPVLYNSPNVDSLLQAQFAKLHTDPFNPPVESAAESKASFISSTAENSLSSSPVLGSAFASNYFSPDFLMTPATFGRFNPPANDDEEISIISKCSMVTRRNPSTAPRRSSRGSIGLAGASAESVLAAAGSPSTRHLNRTASAQPNSIAVAPGSIVAFVIGAERVVTVVDSGAIEVYK